ncbi:NUMOD4 domain-containing protein [Mycobacterium sp.]|uniref:NUMOD4 domain-containing protein n=1 Tax=Mycobacterium sp. TaxID=1785 RepID=UPI003F9DD161
MTTVQVSQNDGTGGGFPATSPGGFPPTSTDNPIPAQCAICARELENVPPLVSLCPRCKAVLRTSRLHGFEPPHAPLTTRREFFLPVRGFEGRYEVSNKGHVRSFRKVGRPPKAAHCPAGGTIQSCGKLLSATVDGGGYPRVILGRGGRSVRVHTVVLEAWVCPRPSGHECLHGDDVRRHNHLRNLRWGTRSENMRECVSRGRHNNASKTHCRNGHRYDEANTIHDGSGRLCRKCHNESCARYRACVRARRAAQRPRRNTLGASEGGYA